MERKVEKSKWALSESNGWVKISVLYYTDEKETVLVKQPDDTVLVKEYISGGSFPAKQTCIEVWRCNDDNRISAAIAESKADPEKPYL